MHCFKIRHRSENTGSDDKLLHSTYVAAVDGDDYFKVLLNREMGRVLLSRFESLSNKFRDFEICQINSAGLRRIAATESVSRQRIGEIYGNKIICEDQTLIIDHVVGASSLNRKARIAWSGDPEMYSFRKNSDGTELGCIESPTGNGGHWPTSFISGIVKAFASKETVIWEGQLNSLELDFRLILAAAVTFHSN